MANIINDCELLSFDEYEQKNDLFTLISNIYDSSKIKTTFLIFLFYMCLNFDFFIENVLMKISKNSFDIQKDKLTTKGIIISGMILSLFYIIIDLLTNNSII